MDRIEQVAKEIALNSHGLCCWNSWEEITQEYKDNCFIPLAKQIDSLYKTPDKNELFNSISGILAENFDTIIGIGTLSSYDKEFIEKSSDDIVSSISLYKPDREVVREKILAMTKGLILNHEYVYHKQDNAGEASEKAIIEFTDAICNLPVKDEVKFAELHLVIPAGFEWLGSTDCDFKGEVRKLEINGDTISISIIANGEPVK